MSADGTWNTTMNTPMGAQNGTLHLQTSGATLTGKMVGAQGEIALTDGTVNGNNLTWKAAMTSPFASAFATSTSPWTLNIRPIPCNGLSRLHCGMMGSMLKPNPPTDTAPPMAARASTARSGLKANNALIEASEKALTIACGLRSSAGSMCRPERTIPRSDSPR